MSENYTPVIEKKENKNEIFSAERLASIFDSESPMESNIKRGIWNNLYNSQFENGYIKAIFRSKNDTFKKAQNSLNLILEYINRGMQNNKFKVDSNYLSGLINRSEDRVKLAMTVVLDTLEKQYNKIESNPKPVKVINNNTENIESTKNKDLGSYIDTQEEMSMWDAISKEDLNQFSTKQVPVKKIEYKTTEVKDDKVENKNTENVDLNQYLTRQKPKDLQ